MSYVYLSLLIALATANVLSPRYGEVYFDHSCSASVNDTFQLAMAKFYSFWYSAALKDFKSIYEQEPSCCIAYWAEAYSIYHPLWKYPSPEDFEKGRGLLRSAMDCVKNNTNTTQREKDYIEALQTFYREDESLSREKRLSDFSNEMKEIYEKYWKSNTEIQKDENAPLLYGLSLLAIGFTFDDSKAGYPYEFMAVSLAREVSPTHPGALHFTIHAMDQPALASRALEAANKYLRIAPDIPHAAHMPSHTYVHLGMWEDAIDSNKIAMDGAYNYRNGVLDRDWMHSATFLLFSLLQKGYDEHASAIYQRITDASKDDAAPEAELAGFYLVETRQWRLASEFKLADWAPHVDSWEVSEKILERFVNLLGYVHTNPENVSECYEEILALNDTLPWFNGSNEALAQQREYFWLIVECARAWMLWTTYRVAATTVMEYLVFWQPRTFQPELGYIFSPYDQLGMMKLHLEDYAGAREAYNLSCTHYPDRYWNTYGLAYSSEKLEDRKLAETYYWKLVEITDRRYLPPSVKGVPGAVKGPMREEVGRAREYLRKKEA